MYPKTGSSLPAVPAYRQAGEAKKWSRFQVNKSPARETAGRSRFHQDRWCRPRRAGNEHKGRQRSLALPRLPIVEELGYSDQNGAREHPQFPVIWLDWGCPSLEETFLADSPLELQARNERPLGFSSIPPTGRFWHLGEPEFAQIYQIFLLLSRVHVILPPVQPFDLTDFQDKLSAFQVKEYV